MTDKKSFKRNNEKTVIPTGYPSLDKIIKGWHSSDLIVIASRPSGGKTTFALNIACNASIDYNIPVAFFSLEMPATQLAKRILISETCISSNKILYNFKKLDEEEFSKIDLASEYLSKVPLWIDDTPSLSIQDFRLKVEELVKQKGIQTLSLLTISN